MPKNQHHLAVARQWHVLKKLPTRGPGITVQEMERHLDLQGFKVSEKTVGGDLHKLSRMFAITSDTRTKPYKWKWIDGKSCEIPGIELLDAVSLTLVEGILKKLLPASMLNALSPKFTEAKNKLTEFRKDIPYATWTDKIRYIEPTLACVPPRVDHRAMEIVQEALLNDWQLNIIYEPYQFKKAIEFIVHPLSILQRGSTTYLIGITNASDTPKFYALHRLKKAELIKKPSKHPYGFSLDSFVEEGKVHFGSAETIELKAWVTNKLGIRLAETPVSEDQDIRDIDGRYQLSANVPYTWELEFWILSQADDITIIQPESLKNEISRKLKAAAQNYG